MADFTADRGEAGRRIDQVLHERLPQYSRSRIQQWIRNGRVLVNGAAARASYLLRGGESIQVEPAEPPPLRAEPEEIPLTDRKSTRLNSRHLARSYAVSWL